MKTGFIDWTEKNLAFYLFDKQGSQVKLREGHSVTIEEEFNPSVLNSFIKVKIDEIYLSVPLDLLTLRELAFPFSDKSKISDTIAYELEGILLGNIDSYSIDHIVIESVDESSRVLAVCLEKSKLQEIIDIFSAIDLEPKVVTSIDLRLSGGESDKLLDESVSDNDFRIDAAGRELLNPSINLRQHELSYLGDIERLRKKLRLTTMLIIILLTITGSNSILNFLNLNKEQKSLNDKIQGIYRQIFPEDKKIIDVERQFRGKMNMLIKKKAALVGIPLLDIIRDIAGYENNKVTFHELNADGKNLVLKGSAKSFEDVELLKNALASGFKGVKVIESGTSADKKIIFTIIMQEKTA